MSNLSWWKMTCAAFVLWAATAIAAPAQTFTSLLSFDGNNGNAPEYGSLVQGTDGSIYGTTSKGGDLTCGSPYGCGTVFRITPDGALTTMMHNFYCVTGNCSDGANPYGGLVLATDGTFYGTTANGGVNGWGAIYKITPDGQETLLYSLEGLSGGASPYAGLIQGTDGNFYGTARQGNYSQYLDCFGGCGTVFKITPGGKFTTLYDFCSQPGCTDGGSPAAGLIQGTSGNFYGTATRGGGSDDGTVFEISPKGTLATLYTFGAYGSDPNGGLVEAKDGAFYGTTSYDGLDGKGTIFKIIPGATLTTLYTFCAETNCADGAYPSAGLIQATDGNFYGTTSQGGDITCGEPIGCGTVFRITPGGTLTTLHSFDSTDGYLPYGGLVQATSGIFYGTTTGGNDLTDCGLYGYCGTVFSLDMGLGPFVAFVRPAGRVGQTGGILGQGFTGTTSVSLNGTPMNFTVVSDTFLKATVPTGATTGYVTVTTPSGTLTSNVPFHVLK
jgi:uncharacterized repeat protein (TIGR03803 family)